MGLLRLGGKLLDLASESMIQEKKMDNSDLIRIKTLGSAQDPVRMKRPTTERENASAEVRPDAGLAAGLGKNSA